jgi:hypothetical protein
MNEPTWLRPGRTSHWLHNTVCLCTEVSLQASSMLQLMKMETLRTAVLSQVVAEIQLVAHSAGFSLLPLPVGERS